MGYKNIRLKYILFTQILAAYAFSACPTGKLSAFRDADNDGYRSKDDTSEYCYARNALPKGYTFNLSYDCNDKDSTRWVLNYYKIRRDKDGDRYTKVYNEGVCVGSRATVPKSMGIGKGEDCDDSNEVTDGFHSSLRTTLKTFKFVDLDGDGYLVKNTSSKALCVASGDPKYANVMNSRPLDCNDKDNTISGDKTFNFYDGDLDGFTVPKVTTFKCFNPAQARVASWRYSEGPKKGFDPADNNPKIPAIRVPEGAECGPLYALKVFNDSIGIRNDRFEDSAYSWIEVKACPKEFLDEGEEYSSFQGTFDDFMVQMGIMALVSEGEKRLRDLGRQPTEDEIERVFYKLQKEYLSGFDSTNLDDPEESAFMKFINKSLCSAFPLAVAYADESPGVESSCEAPPPKRRNPAAFLKAVLLRVLRPTNLDFRKYKYEIKQEDSSVDISATVVSAVSSKICLPVAAAMFARDAIYTGYKLFKIDRASNRVLSSEWVGKIKRIFIQETNPECCKSDSTYEDIYGENPNSPEYERPTE